MISRNSSTMVSGDIYNNESRLERLHHPKMRKIFLQLGRTFQLPDSILRMIYLILQSSTNYEDHLTCCFHRNILLLNVLLSHKDIESLGSSFVKDYSSYSHKDLFNVLYDHFYGEQTPFDYRIPMGRDCEWCIKNSSNKKLIFNNDHSIQRVNDIRERLFLEINILGEEKYIYVRDDRPNLPISYKPASRKVKLNYVNTSSFNEIYNDYSSFKEVKGGSHESLYTLFISDYGYGDTMYFNSEI